MDETPPSGRFTAGQLVDLATQNGLRASARLITDWVELGLLDQPERRGLGRGKGSAKGTWSADQAGLFVDLLMLRQRPDDPVSHVAGLANVPVAGWLWMGDLVVPLRQVRRALATWCGRHRTRKRPATAQTKSVVREIVKQVENPHARKRDREALRQLLTTTLEQRTLDPGGLRASIERVFDPHQLGRTLGPPEVPFSAATAAHLLTAQATGYLALDTFTDEEFEHARLIYLAGRREYAVLQPALAANRNGSPLRFEEEPLDALNNACRNLLLILGLGRLSPARHIQLAAEAAHGNTHRTEGTAPVNS
jgi:hypothetical protein